MRLSKGLDPDQARQFVGPDLGPNCLHILSADDISVGKELNMHGYLLIFCTLLT